LYRENVNKKKIKKKKYAVFSFESEIPTSILKNVRDEAKRTETYSMIRKQSVESGEFNKLLKNLVTSANKVASERKFKNFSEMIISDAHLNRDEISEGLAKFQSNLNVSDHYTKILNFAKETNETISALEPHNILFYENQWLKSKRSFRDESIEEYFPISRVLEATEKYCEKYFNISFKSSNFDSNESWNPKNLRKIELIQEGKKIGVLYLDIFKQDEKKTIVSSNSKVSVISTNFEKNILGLPTILSHSQMKQLLRFIGQSIFSFKSKNSNILLKQTFASLFERISFDKDFLKSMKHFETSHSIFDEYVEDLLNIPSISVFEAYKEVSNSLIELKLFEDSNYKNLEDPTFSFLPEFKNFKNLGTNFVQFYSQIIASQLWDQVLQKEQNQINILFELDSPQNILKKLIGSTVPNPSFLIKEITRE
jgi:hypothetical protein